VFKKILLGLLLTMGVAQADVFYAEDGFVISSDVGNITRTAQIGSMEGNFFQVIGGGDSNVTISNANGLFDFNMFSASGHYPQDYITVSVYGQDGLIDSFIASAGIHPGDSYFNVSYLYIESSYPLGVYYFTLPEMAGHSISAVPEPGEWAMILLGVGALMGLSRRHRGAGSAMALPA